MLNREEFEKLEAYEYTPEEKNIADKITEFVKNKYGEEVYKCVFRYDDFWLFEGDSNGELSFIHIYTKTTAGKEKIRNSFAFYWDCSEDKEEINKLLNKCNIKYKTNYTLIYVSFEQEALEYCYSVSGDCFKTVRSNFFNPETMLSINKRYLRIVYKSKKCLDDAIESGETERLKKAYYDFIKPYDTHNCITMDKHLLAIFEYPEIAPSPRDEYDEYWGFMQQE